MSQSEKISQNKNKELSSILIKKLHTFLIKEDGAENHLALRALSKIDIEQAHEIIIAQLHSPDPDLRCDVGEILANITVEKSIDPLIENLKRDPCGEAKVIYVKALQQLNTLKAIDLLCTLVKGRGEEIGIDWEDDASGWDDWLDVQIGAINALGQICDDANSGQAVIAIIEALEDDEGQELWPVASRSLARLGAHGINALEKLTNIVSSLNRKRIGKALAKADCNQSADLLLRLTKDSEKLVRMAAFESAISRKLEHIYKNGLNDSEPEIRVLSLSAYQKPSKQLLLNALNDNSPMVQIAACEQIAKISKQHAKSLKNQLGLIKRGKKMLRKGPPNVLSALIKAGSIIEPEETGELVVDIANHLASSREVRLASLRALASLKIAKSVSILAIALADERQDIRLEAIAALGEISKGTDKIAKQATLVLAQAISGELVAIPKGWQEKQVQVKQDNVTYLHPKQFHTNNSSNKEDFGEGEIIQIDREGNIVKAINPTQVNDEKLTEEILEKKKLNAPKSTLEAIFASSPHIATKQENVEMKEADIAFLELTALHKKRRRLNPKQSRPAHLDVRRLAAIIGGQTGKQELVDSLAACVNEQDKELSSAAIEALSLLQKSGANIGVAFEDLLRLSITGKATIRAQTLTLIGVFSDKKATRAIQAGINDKTDIVRAAALRASVNHKIDLDLKSLCNNGERQTRLAAAKLVTKLPSREAIPILIDFAFVEDGVHKENAATLLATYGQVAFEAVLEIISDEDIRKRIIGLNLLFGML